ncbi:MAG: MMPL family transporter, partial [bacterium]
TLNEMNKIFGGTESMIVVTREDARGLEDALNEIRKMPEVKGISSYFTILDPALPVELLPEKIFKRFNGGGYTFASITINKLGESDWRALRNRISRLLKEKVEGETYITGESILLKDVKEVSEEDQTKTSKVSFSLMLLIVALGFLSLSIPVTLVAVIQTAIWVNIGYYFLFHIPMPFFIPALLGTIQLGSTIDYSVLLTSRYQEERRNGFSPVDAINEAVHWSSHSIFTSAGTMILMNLPVAILSDIKLLSFTMASLARGAFLSLLAVTFLLPGVLVALDRIFRCTSYKWSKEGERNEKI